MENQQKKWRKKNGAKTIDHNQIFHQMKIDKQHLGKQTRRKVVMDKLHLSMSRPDASVQLSTTVRWYECMQLHYHRAQDRLQKVALLYFQNQAIQMFMVFLSLLACIDYLLEAYMVYGNGGILNRTLEYVFFASFAIDFLLTMAINASWIGYVFSFNGLIDIASLLPIICIIEVGSNVQNVQYLRFLRAVKVLRVLRLHRILDLEYDVAQRDASDEILLRTTKLVLTFAGVVFISTGFVFALQAENEAHFDVVGMDWHDALYFVVTTLSTVGYGDISPDTVGARMLTIVIILVAFVFVPSQVSKTLEALSSRPKYIKGYKSDNDHIIIIGCQDCQLLKKLLTQIYHSNWGTDNWGLETVILSTVSPDNDTKLLLAQSRFRHVVTYIKCQGESFDYTELKKAKAHTAKGVLILTDNSKRNSFEETMIQGVAVRRVIRRERGLLDDAHLLTETRVITQISSNQDLEPILEETGVFAVLNVNKLRMALMACGTLCPGFLALFWELSTHFKYNERKSSHWNISEQANFSADALEEYTEGSLYGLYNVDLANNPDVFSRQHIKKWRQMRSFESAVRQLYEECDGKVILLGGTIKHHKKKNENSRKMRSLAERFQKKVPEVIMMEEFLNESTLTPKQLEEWERMRQFQKTFHDFLRTKHGEDSLKVEEERLRKTFKLEDISDQDPEEKLHHIYSIFTQNWKRPMTRMELPLLLKELGTDKLTMEGHEALFNRLRHIGKENDIDYENLKEWYFQNHKGPSPQSPFLGSHKRMDPYPHLARVSLMAQVRGAVSRRDHEIEDIINCHTLEEEDAEDVENHVLLFPAHTAQLTSVFVLASSKQAAVEAMLALLTPQHNENDGAKDSFFPLLNSTRKRLLSSNRNRKESELSPNQSPGVTPNQFSRSESKMLKSLLRNEGTGDRNYESMIHHSYQSEDIRQAMQEVTDLFATDSDQIDQLYTGPDFQERLKQSVTQLKKTINESAQMIPGNIQGHVILLGSMQHAEHFILPFRRLTQRPIVIVTEKEEEFTELLDRLRSLLGEENLHALSNIFLKLGSAKQKSVIRQCNISTAYSIVALANLEHNSSQENPDIEVLLTAFEVENILDETKVHFVVELISEDNICFLRQGYNPQATESYSTVDEGLSLQERRALRSKSLDVGRTEFPVFAKDEVQGWPLFRAGRIFSKSVLDVLSARIFFSPDELQFWKAVLKVEHHEKFGEVVESPNANYMCGSFDFVEIPREIADSFTYHELFMYLLERRYICLGLYRSARENVAPLEYTCVNPSTKSELRHGDRAFVIKAH